MTGFAKSGLIHAFNFATLRMCNSALGMGDIDILVHDYYNANISRLPRLLI